ncbi:DUF47 family protein [Candidatus Sumerlaeota bacterium]|nr:DUF47 family protein [Candidatus Sumerlaeota bacterium]
MAFSLIPREMKFFDMFDETAAILVRASDKFLAMVTEFDRLPERSEQLKNEEHACDESVRRIIESLDKTFITPFDREDIHTLATSMDDILDNMEETSHRFTALRISKPTPAAVELARIIKDCCAHIAEALKSCRTMKNIETLQLHVREISRLENEADATYRHCISEMFAAPTDVLEIIKWRELYGLLEDTVDSCRNVAHVISEIVIKGT